MGDRLSLDLFDAELGSVVPLLQLGVVKAGVVKTRVVKAGVAVAADCTHIHLCEVLRCRLFCNTCSSHTGVVV